MEQQKLIAVPVDLLQAAASVLSELPAKTTRILLNALEGCKEVPTETPEEPDTPE